MLVEIRTPEGKATGLLHDSAIACENLYTVEKRYCKAIGQLSDDLIGQVDDALRTSLDL